MENREGRLTLAHRRRLSYLASYLDECRYAQLAGSVREYLDDDARLSRRPPSEISFSNQYMHSMAGEIARAIEKRGKLILGCLWNPENEYSAYRAVFVWDEGDEDESVDEDESMDEDESADEDESMDEDESEDDSDDEIFAFTASRQEDVSPDDDLNDLNRHVSFEVDIEAILDQDGGIPCLAIRRWLPGLCDFRGISRREVVFPWPADLEKSREWSSSSRRRMSDTK